MIAGFVAGGGAVLFVLAVMAIEAAILLARRPGNGMAIAFALLPGAFMLAALWVAQARGWAVVALLTASLPFHLLDLHRRGWFSRGG